MTNTDETTIDHWWWRPGWHIGRSFYTWHVTFADSPAIHALVERFAPALSQLPTFDPVPVVGLHITMQGIGFVGEVDDGDIARIVEAAAANCARVAPLELHLGPPAVDREALGLPVANPYGLSLVRSMVQAAIGEVWGIERVPEQDNVFRPHLTLAYSAGVIPIRDAYAALAGAGLEGFTLVEAVDRISLIELHRDNKQYEWRDVAEVRFDRRRS